MGQGLQRGLQAEVVAAEDVLQLHGVPLGEGGLQPAHLVLQLIGLLLLARIAQDVIAMIKIIPYRTRA